MFSSGLLKRGFTLQQEGKCVINGDELARKRIEQLAVRTEKQEDDGFTPGLQAPTVELQEEDEDPATLLEQAKEEAGRLLKEAEEEARTLRRVAEVNAEKEKNLILEQARAQGYEEGLARAREESARLEKEWQEKNIQLEADYQSRLDRMEPELVEVITGVYEHIFQVELGKNKEVLAFLISSAMRNIEGSRSFFIHVSKEDYEFVNSRKTQIAAEVSAGNISVEVIEDMSLSENQCMIETECGIFDCGLGTQLSELRQKLKLLSYEKQP